MAPSSSRLDPEIKHDVFISFRGADVRKGLLSHLKKELRRRLIDFYADDRLDRGEQISSTLLRAIEGSQISLVIFSKDYASSKWCLEELAKIIECMENVKHIVLPVFFNVDPSDVRNQRGEYGIALANHEENFKEHMLEVQNWRSALRKAGELAGYHYPTQFEDESDLLDKIVEDILEKLIKFCSTESNGLIGIDRHIAQIQSLLITESSEVIFLGIWGMGGIGKSTIARAIFDKYYSQYYRCCLLNVREELEQHGYSLRFLRKKLLSELLEGEDLHTSGTRKASFRSSASRRMPRKKFLLVLDDVNTSEELHDLVGELNCFGPGSRVIITSRDVHVLKSGGVHQIHKVEKMGPRDSLKLFCLNAFNESQPKMGYEKLSEEVVKIAQGNPLAIKVLGSDFHSRSIDTWECALRKIKKYPNEKIQRVLRFSYDGLHEVEKNAFLDIAFFFKDDDKDYVIRQLDARGFYGASSIEVLQQKALITISNDNRIQMHDLIKGMGYEIVRQESIKYPGQRSRLRDNEEIYDVLRHNLGTEVEAMQIDLSQITDSPLKLVDTLKKMSHLRFLKFYYPLHAELSTPPSHVKGLLQGLQDIVGSKGMDLSRSDLLVVPPQFSIAKNLECANLESCHSSHDLVNLNTIDVSGSKQLMKLPNLSKASNLDREYLLECESLCDAHGPILALRKQLASLLSQCKDLMSIGSEIHIKCLYYLLIDGCSGVKEFSVTSKETGQLNVTHPGIEILNSSIVLLDNLDCSDVDDQQFKNLPNELFCLRSTYYLKLSKSTRQDAEKPKLHILFDGLRYYQRVHFNDLYSSIAVPQNISGFSLCHALIVELESRAGMLLEASPLKAKVRVKGFHSLVVSMIHFSFIYNPYNDWQKELEEQDYRKMLSTILLLQGNWHVFWYWIRSKPKHCILNESVIHENCEIFECFWENKIPSKVNLGKRAIYHDETDMLCDICHRHIENVQHLFLRCEFSFKLWYECHNWWGLSTVLAALYDELLWEHQRLSKRSLKLKWRG